MTVASTRTAFDTLWSFGHRRLCTWKQMPAGTEVPNIRCIVMEDEISRVARPSEERTDRRAQLQVVHVDGMENIDHHWIIDGEEWIQRIKSSLEGPIRVMNLVLAEKEVTSLGFLRDR